ncbi:MAG: hypothetical protein AAGB46_01225, partial [Verrucomicrobiota bacterium]
FVIDLPETDPEQEFIVLDIAPGAPFELLPEDPLITFPADGGSIIRLSDHPDGTVQVGVRNNDTPGFFDPFVRYTVTAEGADFETGVVITNTGDQTIAFQITTNEINPNDGNFIVLQPGGVFREYFDIELTGFNIRNLHDVQFEKTFESDFGWDFSIPAGREQVVNMNLQIQEFFDAALFTN